jgi:hypothetical protein
MLSETFWLFEVFLFVLLAGAFLKREILLWAFAAVLAGILAFMSFSIDFVVPTVAGTLGALNFQDYDSFIVHVGIMMVSTTMLLLDVVQSYNWSLLAWWRARREKSRKYREHVLPTNRAALDVLKAAVRKPK